jgi:hypothetical protein
VRLVRSDEGYGFEVQSRGRRGRAAAAGKPMPRRGCCRWRRRRRGSTPLAIAARLPAPETGDGLPSPQEAHLAFGPRWRVLAARSHSATEGLARLRLPAAFAGEPAQGWRLHPALMDLATGWAMGLIAGYRPITCGCRSLTPVIRGHRAAPADIVSHVRNAAANTADRPTAVFDITLATPAGEVWSRSPASPSAGWTARCLPAARPARAGV